MPQILIVESSPRGSESASRRLTRKLKERLAALHPDAIFMERDLAKESVPHLDYPTIKAIFSAGPVKDGDLQSAVHLSDQLTAEVLAADILVISTPLWNFGLPSVLKAWIDHVVRAGKTFAYTADGAKGLALGKKAILLLASGGVFTEGPWKPFDTEEPYLRQILGFIGIEDVQTARAEGMNIPALAANGVSRGEEAIDHLAL
jgi:FMN-dependent NADH-azoreductase